MHYKPPKQNKTKISNEKYPWKQWIKKGIIEKHLSGLEEDFDPLKIYPQIYHLHYTNQHVKITIITIDIHI